MKELERFFIGKGEVKGFIFTQMDQSPKAFLYQVQVPNPETQEIIEVHYEVFMRKENIQPQLNIFKVYYPRSTSFGKWAWTFSNYEQALKQFNKVK